MLKEGSLFSGYGGLSLAVCAAFNAETVFVSDVDPGANLILAHRYPHAPNLGDITEIDWHTIDAQLGPIDILSGGFPCQDVSPAGKRAGLRHGTRSGLWHQFARAIAELRPRYVVIENVRGLLTARGDEPTAAHLAAEASAAAAARLLDWLDNRHAHATRLGDADAVQTITTRRFRVMGCRRRALARAQRHERNLIRAIGTVLGTLADLGYDAEWHGLRAADVGAPHNRFRIFIVGDNCGASAATTDADGSGLGGVAQLDGIQIADSPTSEHRGYAHRLGMEGHRTDWGPYAPAIRRWERALGRTAPAPTEPGPQGGARLAPRFVEWMMGLPAGWVTDTPGLTRNDMLKALGNGVVPQQGYAAVAYMLALYHREDITA